MSSKHKLSARIDSGIVEVKSKFEAEFRRISVRKNAHPKFEDFYAILERLHQLEKQPFIVTYTDREGDLLPINNDDNYGRALTVAKPILRLCVQRKGDGDFEVNGFGTMTRKKNPIISKLISQEVKPQKPGIQISLPGDFRRVSAIIDVDIVPETHRRVKLMKNGTDKPLGFYIRDGTSVRVTQHGLEKVPGIFISRLVPGGLAESTGLLAVNDEVLEVNGIEVAGKTLDQVTDMMVANSSNLIITVKPVNQRNNISPKRGVVGRMSQKSTGSFQSAQSGCSQDSDEVREYDEHDEVRDYLSSNLSSNKDSASGLSTSSQQQKQQEAAATVATAVVAPQQQTTRTENKPQTGSGRNSPVVTF